jgi:hypothetical protein
MFTGRFFILRLRYGGGETTHRHSGQNASGSPRLGSSNRQNSAVRGQKYGARGQKCVYHGLLRVGSGQLCSDSWSKEVGSGQKHFDTRRKCIVSGQKCFDTGQKCIVSE